MAAITLCHPPRRVRLRPEGDKGSWGCRFWERPLLLYSGSVPALLSPRAWHKWAATAKAGETVFAFFSSGLATDVTPEACLPRLTSTCPLRPAPTSRSREVWPLLQACPLPCGLIDP